MMNFLGAGGGGGGGLDIAKLLGLMKGQAPGEERADFRMGMPDNIWNAPKPYTDATPDPLVTTPGSAMPKQPSFDEPSMPEQYKDSNAVPAGPDQISGGPVTFPGGPSMPALYKVGDMGPGKGSSSIIPGLMKKSLPPAPVESGGLAQER